ncbi:Hypothetical predicted protein [Podarcis lilfordi]|uniref:Uncharacterized protein n=1 Tax=Podarcis lilfordi TaxID=74358 RepID=A0AA35JMG4_9SAUR|nr:Hypothetical predicted protein [Podarcis lilfordi]
MLRKKSLLYKTPLALLAFYSNNQQVALEVPILPITNSFITVMTLFTPLKQLYRQKHCYGWKPCRFHYESECVPVYFTKGAQASQQLFILDFQLHESTVKLPGILL